MNINVGVILNLQKKTATNLQKSLFFSLKSLFNHERIIFSPMIGIFLK